MKEINLTKGKVAIVDDDDFEKLNQYKWHALPSKHTFYAVRNDLTSGERKYIYMHKVIVNTPEGMLIDHRDGNGLNNQRRNLRTATINQNSQNRRPYFSASSRFKGVSWHKSSGKWQARITLNGKQIRLGSFSDEKKAASAYYEAAKQMFGEFAKIQEVVNA
jgi:hypothetical protein